MRLLVLVCAATVAVSTSAQATVYFQNTGTTSGWDYVTREHLGTVTQVSSPVFSGSTAVRCVQTYDAAHGDTTLHSELGKRNVGQIGQERYYAWTIRIPGNTSTGGTISQIATESCGSGRQTEMMVITGSGVIDLKTKHGNPCSPVTGRYNIVSFMTKDVWHRIVIRKRWRDDTSAITEVWYDGTKTLSRTGVSNSITGTSLLYRWSIGNYAGFGGNIDGETRTMFVDHARVTDTYSEAEPANWSDGGTLPTPTPTPTRTPTPTATPCSGCSSGYYRIMARHSGKAVAVQSASTANGGDVVQWTYGGTTTNDEWQLVDLLNGYHRIVNRHSGKVLNVAGASTANGANVDQWSWASVNQQQWQITDLGNGYVRITARHSGKVLNVAGASTADGANVDQWSWANVNQQQFQLVAVP